MRKGDGGVLAESIGAGIVLLLAVYGCVQGVRQAVLRLLRPPKHPAGLWFVPVSGHREDAEYLVRSLSARRRWGGEGTEVCLVDVGADRETRAVARRACEEVPGVCWLTPEEAAEFLSRRTK